MEDIEVVNNNAKIPINATKIIFKYKNINDRMSFCFEKNWYHPNEIRFDANFFLKVLMGEKNICRITSRLIIKCIFSERVKN